MQPSKKLILYILILVLFLLSETTIISLLLFYVNMPNKLFQIFLGLIPSVTIFTITIFLLLIKKTYNQKNLQAKIDFEREIKLNKLAKKITRFQIIYFQFYITFQKLINRFYSNDMNTRLLSLIENKNDFDLNNDKQYKKNTIDPKIYEKIWQKTLKSFTKEIQEKLKNKYCLTFENLKPQEYEEYFKLDYALKFDPFFKQCGFIQLLDVNLNIITKLKDPIFLEFEFLTEYRTIQEKLKVIEEFIHSIFTFQNYYNQSKLRANVNKESELYQQETQKTDYDFLNEIISIILSLRWILTLNLLETKNVLQHKIYNKIFYKIMNDLKNNYPCNIIVSEQKLNNDLDDMLTNRPNVHILINQLNKDRLFE